MSRALGQVNKLHSQRPEVTRLGCSGPFSFFFSCLHIYFERARERVGEGQRERERERERERVPSRLHTVNTEPSMGLDPTNHEIMT